jgi:hypothetical protein
MCLLFLFLVVIVRTFFTSVFRDVFSSACGFFTSVCYVLLVPISVCTYFTGVSIEFFMTIVAMENW